MGLVDELSNLNDLHSTGAISDDEYAQAKARLLANGTPVAAQVPGKVKGKTNPLRLLLLLGVLAAILWFALHRSTPQEIASNPLLSAAASLVPVEVADSVENLPANSIAGLPITLPYAGNLQLEIRVIKGNPVDVYLIEPSEFEAVRNRKEFRYIAGFEAKETSSYLRRKRMPKGVFQLILMDRTLGILSANSSDIQVKGRLEP